MNAFFNKHFSLLHPIKRLARLLVLCAALIACVCLSSCKKNEVDYFLYVSELRSNILLAGDEDFSLRVYAVEKEYPYSADGIKRDCTTRTEVYLIAPSGDKNCNLSFSVDGKEYGGEMSFDNVKCEYYFSCTLDTSKASEINFLIRFGETEKNLTAKTVKTQATLPPEKILLSLSQTETELFASLTDEYGFAGEIYLRLIFEESPYYYIGVIDRNGNITAFLLHAESGKILAKRQP